MEPAVRMRAEPVPVGPGGSWGAKAVMLKSQCRPAARNPTRVAPPGSGMAPAVPAEKAAPAEIASVIAVDTINIRTSLRISPTVYVRLICPPELGY
ncbi:hypothetical protein NJB1907Z4_C54320 [Mycobacterium pseudoshottsii]|uniref:Uncharacterized protein n=2 Tax=Mycobacterium ulcerans group TaxID=2993898 RepID=A0A9N7LXP8_9MYCO|nr:hypothetical protein NJB1907Z4_C54320 [Mycobacterium pseudoshottsii]